MFPELIAWQERDSNPRLSAYEAAVLPLHHPAMARSEGLEPSHRVLETRALPDELTPFAPAPIPGLDSHNHTAHLTDGYTRVVESGWRESNPLHLFPKQVRCQYATSGWPFGPYYRCPPVPARPALAPPTAPPKVARSCDASFFLFSPATPEPPKTSASAVS